MSMAKKVKMLEQEREQWQAELRAVMGRERAQIEAARAADKARIELLTKALEKAATAMWNSETNMDNEAADIESALAALTQEGGS